MNRFPFNHSGYPSPRIYASAALLATCFVLGCCGAPGADQPEADPLPEISTELGAEEVTLEVVAGSCDEALMQALADAFMEENPQVTIDLTLDDCTQLPANAPRLMASDDPPDLIRLSTLGTAVQDGQLTNLDRYAEAYGWDQLPETQRELLRVSDDGHTRGDGSLYGMPFGFGLTGVYFNKAKAEAIGMSQPPTTVEEFETLLAEAEAAGETPMMASNQDGLVAYAYQGLANQFADRDALAQWIYTAPEASFDIDGTLQAAEDIQRWVEAGYFPDGINSLNQDQALGQFIDGEGVFYYSGNWRAATLDEQMPDNAGFFLMPPAEAGDPQVAMSAPAGMAVPRRSDQINVAAYFLNWLQTDAPRALQVQISGLAPAGSPDQAMPEVPAGSVSEAVLQAWADLNEGDGLIAFLADATAGINTSALIPELQLLVEGRTSPEEFVAAVQDAYEQELGS